VQAVGGRFPCKREPGIFLVEPGIILAFHILQMWFDKGLRVRMLTIGADEAHGSAIHFAMGTARYGHLCRMSCA
jgi:hypothetical protein